MLYQSPRPSHIRHSKGQAVIDWIEAHCVYTVGHLAGQPVELLQWEKDFIYHLFAVDGDARRWYRWALLGIPKKNGKTEMAAWLALYFYAGDNEPAPWVACAASADHQADLVFGAAARCVQWSPTLSKVLEPLGREIVVKEAALSAEYREGHVWRIPGELFGAPAGAALTLSPGGKLVRVTSAAGSNDGGSWHAIICDELHEWEGEKGRKLWTILTNGIGGRRQPIILQITTAGIPDDEAVWWQQYELGQRLVDEPDLDPHYLFWWYGPAEDEQRSYKDLTLAEEVNPSWGVTLPDPARYLKDQQTKKTESEYKRYFLNQPTEAADMWLPEGAWDRCEHDELKLDPDRPLFVGVDGALKRDCFAIVAYQPQPVPDWLRERLTELYEELDLELDSLPERVYVVRSRLWENPYPKQHPLHADWKLDLQEPMNYLRELREEFPESAWTDPKDGYQEPGPAFGYDPWALELMMQELEDEGLNVIEVPQTDQRMCPASETLYEHVMTLALVHEKDPGLRRHVHSAVQKEKERGWRLARPKGTSRKIDACIAMAMGAHLAHQQGEQDEGPGMW